MLPTSRSTEDGGKMHRILLGGPFSRYRIIITEPAILPHQAGLDGELVGDPLPPSSFGSKVDKSLDGGYSVLSLSKQVCPACQNGRALGHTCLQIHGARMLNDRTTGLLR